MFSIITNQNQKNNDAQVNEGIRVKEMLVITETGEKLGVLSKNKAIEEAEVRNMDLVLVSPESNPPVAKMMDYSRFRFEQQKKAKESKKKQKIIEIKEIQLTPQIGLHDLETKAKAARKFLEDGNRVKVGVRFRGRQLSHVDVGEEVLNRFIDMLQDISKVDKAPALDGKWLTAVLASTVK